MYHKISTKNFGGFIMPEQETAKRYFTPRSSAGRQTHTWALKQGQARLKTISVELAAANRAKFVAVSLDSKPIPSVFRQQCSRLQVELDSPATLSLGTQLEIGCELAWAVGRGIRFEFCPPPLTMEGDRPAASGRGV